jgi:hypothetical protein
MHQIKSHHSDNLWNFVAESYRHISQRHVHMPYFEGLDLFFIIHFGFVGGVHIVFGQSESWVHLILIANMKKDNKIILLKLDKNNLGSN